MYICTHIYTCINQVGREELSLPRAVDGEAGRVELVEGGVHIAADTAQTFYVHSRADVSAVSFTGFFSFFSAFVFCFALCDYTPADLAAVCVDFFFCDAFTALFRRAFVHVHIRHTYRHTHTDTLTHAHTHARTHTHTHTHMFLVIIIIAHMFVQAAGQRERCTCVHVYVCIYVYMYICICIHI